MRTFNATLGLMVCAGFSQLAGADILLKDTFDGGGLRANQHIGGSWITKSSWHMKMGESESAFTRKVGGKWGNGGLLSSDTFNSWTPQGHSYSWRTGRVETNAKAPYTHELWVSNAANDKSGYANVYWNQKGGLAVRLNYDNQGENALAVTGKLFAFSDAKRQKEMTGSIVVGEFRFDTYDGHDWLDSRLDVNEHGFNFFSSQALTWSQTLTGAELVHDGLAINWDAVNAALAGRSAASGRDEGQINASVFESVRIGDLLSHQSKHNSRGIGSTDEISVSSGYAAAPIPEPATTAVLGLGLGLILRRRRR